MGQRLDSFMERLWAMLVEPMLAIILVLMVLLAIAVLGFGWWALFIKPGMANLP